MAASTIAAVVGAGASIGGAIAGANAQKSAAASAAQAQLQATRLNNQLARDFRRENTANLGSFISRGDIAGAYYNALLGLPNSYYVQRTPNGMPRRLPVEENDNQTPAPTAGGVINALGGTGSTGGTGATDDNQQQPIMRSMVTRVSAKNAFDRYRGSTGYQFRLNQGFNALNNGLASAGLLRSGKAMKDALRYGQNFASNEFGNYLGYLGGQQNTGLAAANGLAGVGTNALNAMTANNNAAASAQGNAALYSGQANSNMWSGIGSGLGNLFGSSFGGIGSSQAPSYTGYGPNAIDNTWNFG